MPESNQPNYRYIMDNLFKWVFIPTLFFWASWQRSFKPVLKVFFCHRYIIGTLELLVAENYMIVYLNGATSRKKMPAVGWLRKCYQQIDRRWVWVAPRSRHSKQIVQVQMLHSLHKPHPHYLLDYFKPDTNAQYNGIKALLEWLQLLTLYLQVKEELEVFDNRPPLLVHSHPVSTHKTFHKVTLLSKIIATTNMFSGDV